MLMLALLFACTAPVTPQESETVEETTTDTGEPVDTAEDTGEADTDTDTDADTDVDTDTDTDVDTDTDSDPDPMGLVGEWYVSPCPCHLQATTNNCTPWTDWHLSDGWDGVSMNPSLLVREDSTATLLATVRGHDEHGVMFEETLRHEWTWAHAGGSLYDIGSASWDLEQTSGVLNASCGAGLHALIPK